MIPIINVCLMLTGLSLDTIINDVRIGYIVFVSVYRFGRP